MRRSLLTRTSAIFALAVAAMAVVVTYDVETIPPTALAVVALVTFAAVVSAAMLIAWAGEASQFSVSQGLALAVVALVQTLPEFFVEGGIAWLAGQDPGRYLDLVIANFTGANRLLSGLGWPLILFIVGLQRRRTGQKGNGIALRGEHSIEVVFMLGASSYYILIIIKGTLTVLDSIVMSGVFLVYLYLLSKLPSEDEDPNEVLEGVPLGLVGIRNARAKAATILGLFLFSGLVFVTIVEPFVKSMERIATILFGSLAVFFFIQWVAPFLSEFPEKVTAFHWARTIKLAPMALLNFVSSSVNELTILVAIIPLVFSISSGLIQPVPIADHSGEILLTMAQSLYASASLLGLRYGLRNASILFSLWLVSLLIPVFTYNDPVLLSLGRETVSAIFLVLAGVEVFLHRGNITVFHEFRQTIREYVKKTAPTAS
ncbi:MAG TPA: hypothetical protein VI816_03430 [Candidatus Bathyarchaeia archaeon]|nr:hypothetical protein [Candidatus Bathyarchaeia archaeon]